MPTLEDQLFNLKFTSKQIAKMSEKCEKKEKEEKKKVKAAIEKGNVEAARIYAQNAIRERNQGLNYLRLSSRLDGAASRIAAAVQMKQVTKSMSGVVVTLDKAMKSMDINMITKVMDTFEKQFEDLEVRDKYVEDVMGQATSSTTPASQVDDLIGQVAAEYGLSISEQMSVSIPNGQLGAEKQSDDLADRLAKLKSKA